MHKQHNRRNKSEMVAKKKQLAEWNGFLLDPEIVGRLKDLTDLDFIHSSENLRFLLDVSAKFWNRESLSLENFFQFFNDAPAVQNRNPKLVEVHRHFKNLFRSYKKEKASHWEKRQLVKELGLRQPSFSVMELLKAKQHGFRGITFIERTRNIKHGVKRYTRLSEIDDSNSLMVNETTGYYVVKEEESVIFYSFCDATHENITIELVIIRGVALNTPFSPLLYSWLADVVKQACSERRNVRPTHPGQLVQVGLNMGPRHARVLGWAKSFTKKLDGHVMVDHDLDAVGALSIMWSMVQSTMPSEILSVVDSRLAEVGLPRLATRNVEEGCGFHIRIGDNVYLFPTAERAPPEGYLSYGYEAWTHTDQAYCKYAFVLCSERQIHDVQTHPFPGSSFVDIGLKVVVRQAAGTMTAFQPEYLHGTTSAHGAVNTSTIISFSRRINDAWEDAKKLNGQVQVVPKDGVVEET